MPSVCSKRSRRRCWLMASACWSADERLAIDAQMRAVARLMAGSDGLAIEQQTKRLTQVTDAFAARRLDATVKAACLAVVLNEIEE